MLFFHHSVQSLFSAKEEDTCSHVNKVKILANGSCIWYREFQQSVTHCPMDIWWFPFDEQLCPLKFESKTRESRELHLTPIIRNEKIHYFDFVHTDYINNGEWSLVGEA